MRNRAILILALFGLSLAAQAQDPSQHLPKMRNITGAPGAKQNYIVPDESVWRGARPDLGDLRIMAGSAEVPYALQLQAGSSRTGSTPVRIFNKGGVGAKTQFLLDVNVPEYDQIQLNLAKKNFVSRAKLEASDNLSASKWVALGEFTLFDFTKEDLGSNTSIHLHTPVRYRFVRVEIQSGIPPDAVKSASVANLQVSKAKYRDATVVQRSEQQGKRTIFRWTLEKKVPVDRVLVDVDSKEVNFSRSATLFCDDHPQSTADLSRVHLQRQGRMIDSENLDVASESLHCSEYRLEIDNGDNPPLRIALVKAQSIERRLYFEPHSGNVALFYGWEKLSPPVYDMAKFFEPAADAVEAQLGPEEKNPHYQPPPDERPWTERHPALIWIVLLLVIVGLGGVALKSLTK